MTDIVERLEALADLDYVHAANWGDEPLDYTGLIREAADEIERLQREVAIGVSQRDVLQAALIARDYRWEG